MKNILTLLLIFSLPLLSHAQLGKGVSTFDTDIDINGEFSILNLNHGGFVSENILLGSELGLGYFSNSFASILSIGVNPYARFYLNPKQNNTFLYLQADYSYSQLLLDADGSNSGFGLNLGLNHFVAPGIALNTLAGVNYFGENGDYSKSLNLTVNLNAYLLPTGTNKRGETIGQFRKGSLIIGGSSAGLTRNLDNPSWSLNFSPRVGYFLSNKFVAGAGISLNYNKSHTGFGAFTNSQFSFSPFARFYLHYPKRFNPFILINIAYTSVNSSFQIFEENNDKGLLGFGVGGNYFVTPNLAIEGILSLNSETENDASQLNLSVGVQYFIH